MLPLVEKIALAGDLTQQLVVISLRVLSADAVLARVTQLSLTPDVDLVGWEVLFKYHDLLGVRHHAELL